MFETAEMRTPKTLERVHCCVYSFAAVVAVAVAADRSVVVVVVAAAAAISLQCC